MNRTRDTIEILHKILEECKQDERKVSQLTLRCRMAHNPVVSYLDRLIKLEMIEKKETEEYPFQKPIITYRTTQKGKEFGAELERWVELRELEDGGIL